ncbi:kti12, chromatin associated [Terramyces sp. JEL0728]|nr:kti12, chromatin associated [Terramyces sp. JEL0728]
MSKKSREGKEKQVQIDLKTGSFIFPDGSKYDGEYREVDGSIYRHGLGAYECVQTQTTYTGQWELDKMSGKGKIEFVSGDSYDGMWKENQYNGQGTYTWSTTEKLGGEWIDNCVQGLGIYDDEGKIKWAGEVAKGVASVMVPRLE